MSATPRTRRTGAVLTVVAALVVQLLVLYTPEVPGPPSPVPASDKVVHALVFALPVLVAGLAGLSRWRLLAGVLAVHAPVSEVVQHTLLASRSGDPWDVVADLVGVGTAVLWVGWTVR